MGTKMYIKIFFFSIGLFLTFGIASLHGKVITKTPVDDLETLPATKTASLSGEELKPSQEFIEGQNEPGSILNVRPTPQNVSSDKPETQIINPEITAKDEKSHKDNIGLERLVPENDTNVSDNDEQQDYITVDYFSRGKTYLENGETDKAVSDFNRVIDLNNTDARFYLFRGNAYSAKQGYEQALDDYNKAIELDPEYAEAYNNRGYIFYVMQDYKGAIAQFKKAIKINPEFIYAYYNRGNAYAAQRKYRKAISDYSRIIKINPEFSLAYVNRGNVYFQKRRYSKAIKDFNRALELKEMDAQTYIFRGNAYRARYNYDQAINDYNKAIELDPESYMAYLGRGEANKKIDNHGDAINDYSRVIELQPQLTYAYVNRGDLYYRKKEYAEAISDYSKVIESGPYNFFLNSNVYKKRGEAYHRTGQYEKEKYDKIMAAKLNPLQMYPSGSSSAFSSDDSIGPEMPIRYNREKMEEINREYFQNMSSDEYNKYMEAMYRFMQSVPVQPKK